MTNTETRALFFMEIFTMPHIQGTVYVNFLVTNDLHIFWMALNQVCSCRALTVNCREMFHHFDNQLWGEKKHWNYKTNNERTRNNCLNSTFPLVIVFCLFLMHLWFPHPMDSTSSHYCYDFSPLISTIHSLQQMRNSWYCSNVSKLSTYAE